MRREPSPAPTPAASGRFEQAEGGTLFLDEIGDMPMEAQTRLLRVLQQGEYTTVGGRTPIKSDVRIVAATNKDLRHLIQQGLFREDLFFRLNVVPLRLPPLRERTEDIPDLIRHFFALVGAGRIAAEANRSGRHRSSQAVSVGPVTCASSKTSRAGLRRFILRRRSAPRSSKTNCRSRSCRPSATRPEAADDGLAASVERHLARYFAGFQDGLPPPGLYHRILREVEYPLLSAALAATRGNQIRAADLLGSTATRSARRSATSISRSSGPAAKGLGTQLCAAESSQFGNIVV